MPKNVLLVDEIGNSKIAKFFIANLWDSSVVDC